MDSFEELIEKVKQWGRDRNLTDPANLKNQFNKLVSEFGEIGEGIVNLNEDEVEDGCGDTMVVCIILAEQLLKPLTIHDFERNWKAESKIDNNYEFLLVIAQGWLGRLADNIGKGQNEQANENLRGFLSTIVSYAHIESSGLHPCLHRAYNEIKDRKGVLYHGVFIKESDPRYESARAELVARQLGQDSAYQLNRPPEQ
jgi:NTP pyrophosphatase (non-canonical NTP hydrolase)